MRPCESSEPEDVQVAEIDTATAIAALSARTVALEAAVSALAGQCANSARALLLFDDLGREMLDRFVGLPADDGYLDLLRESFDDLRVLFVQR